MRWFAKDFHSWLRHSWKSLANHLTHDQNIVIHGNSCIILYFHHNADSMGNLFYFKSIHSDEIATNSCTSHSSTADMSSAKTSRDQFIQIWIRGKCHLKLLLWIWIMMQQTWVKYVFGHFSTVNITDMCWIWSYCFILLVKYNGVFM